MRSDTCLGHPLREPSSMYSLSTDRIGTGPMSLGFLFVWYNLGTFPSLCVSTDTGKLWESEGLKLGVCPEMS